MHLSYTQVGLLIAVPLLAGGLIELPLGILAGYGARRNQLVLVGGVLFGASLCVVALAGSFGVLLVGLVAFFPASGAFVSLTQASLMDADPPVGRPPQAERRARQQHEGAQRREAARQQRMAAWNLAGSTGAVAGPILLAVVLTIGGSWRWAYLLLAGVTGVAVAIAAVGGPARLASSWRAAEQTSGDDAQPGGGAGAAGANAGSAGANAGSAGGADEDDSERATLREALAAVRDGNVARWLILLEVTDLLLDVLTGYVGIYLVDVVHASPADAALGVAVRLGAGLAGDALFVLASHRISGRVALTVSAVAAAVLYPAFLLVPCFGAKLAVLAALSLVTACWYPVVQAGLYGSLPGRSGIAVSWSSAAGMVGAVGPLLVGVVAQRAGLTWALTGLMAVPAAVLMIAPRSAERTVT